MADAGPSFSEMVHVLSLSKAPLSVRLDQDYKPTTDELDIARRIVAHIGADAAIRARLPTLKVEPLVRAASILLEEGRRSKGGRGARAATDAVLEYLDFLDKAFGNVPSVLNNRGVARSLAGDVVGAEADFASARRLAPAFVAPRVNEIELARRAGDFARLDRIADEIERTDPGNVTALQASVDSKIALRRPSADVLAAARRLHESKGARPNDLFLLGSLTLAASDHAAAEGYLRELVAAEPRHIEGHLRLATTFLEEGKFPEALGLYQKLTEIDGPKHEYLLAIAQIFDQMGRLDDASEAYARALDRASSRDKEIVQEAFVEFKARHGLDAAPPAAGDPLTAAPESAPVAPAAALHVDSVDASSAEDGLEPKPIGDSPVYAIGENEAAARVGPEPLAPPPERSQSAGPELSPDERLAAAFESSAQGMESSDEILGISDVDDEPAIEAQPPAPADEPAASPRSSPRMPASPRGDEPPAGTEAIVPAPPHPQAIIPEGPTYTPVAPAPTVSAPPPRPFAPPDKTAAAAPASPQPIVSAPPPSLEETDPEVAAELEALERLESEARAQTAVETFRRPTFDVDQFMAALEAKTKPVFDHLYDGMLEARRSETALPPAPDRPPSMYESAAPHEAPAVPTSLPSATTPVQVPESVAPMPLLFQAAAEEAVANAAPPPAPRSDPDLWARAQALAKDGDPSAESVLDGYLSGAPADAHAWNLKGDLRERAGDEHAALHAYRNAVKYGPSLKEAWNNLGVLLHLLGRFDDAAQALEAAVAADAHDRHLWHNLGSTYHELGRLDDALTAFNRAIEVDADDKVSHNNKGTTLFEKGDFANARTAFERAVAIDPNFEQARNNLGRTLEQLDDLEGALRAYQSALMLNDRSLTALRNLARVFDRMGRANDASTVRSKLRALGA